MTIEPTQRTSGATEAAAAQADAGRPAATIVKKPDAGVQFEAFFLQSFIQSILPQDSAEVFGEGTAGEVWKSMMAEKMAMQFAEAGGIGIAKMIAPKGQMPGGDVIRNGLAAGKILDMQLSAAQPTAAAASQSAAIDDKIR